MAREFKNEYADCSVFGLSPQTSQVRVSMLKMIWLKTAKKGYWIMGSLRIKLFSNGCSDFFAIKGCMLNVL